MNDIVGNNGGENADVLPNAFVHIDYSYAETMISL